MMLKQRFKTLLKLSIVYQFFLLYKERRDFLKWKKEIDPDNPSPPPNIKREMIKRAAQEIKAQTLVETGTNAGDTPYFLRSSFKKICTIELGPNLFTSAKERLKPYKHIEVVLGDSKEQLPRLMPNIAEPVVFWLDAHYSGDGTARLPGADTPIQRELSIIMSGSLRNYAILIDDAYLFGTHSSYPTIDAVKSLVKKYRPDFGIRVENQIIVVGRQT